MTGFYFLERGDVLVVSNPTYRMGQYGQNGSALVVCLRLGSHPPQLQVLDSSRFFKQPILRRQRDISVDV